MKTVVAAMLMLLMVGCDHRPTVAQEPQSSTDAVYVRRFLETWLVKRDLNAAPGELEQETIKVDDNLIALSPELKPLKGESLIHVMFLLKGCNTGVSLLILPKATSAARVVYVFYLAG